MKEFPSKAHFDCLAKIAGSDQVYYQVRVLALVSLAEVITAAQKAMFLAAMLMLFLCVDLGIDAGQSASSDPSWNTHDRLKLFFRK